MSSVKRRILIEEYDCGGFSIFDEFVEKDIMGLKDEGEVIIEIIKLLKEK